VRRARGCAHIHRTLIKTILFSKPSKLDAPIIVEDDVRGLHSGAMNVSEPR
jgi:hypothetical protein